MATSDDKTATLNFRVTPAFKARFMRLAEADRRSATAEMEWLVEEELKRRERRRA